MTRRKNLPRSVRGAERRGYYIVDVPKETGQQLNVSWLSLCVWTDTYACDHFLNNYMLRQFAFASERDASMFTLKWC